MRARAQKPLTLEMGGVTCRAVLTAFCALLPALIAPTDLLGQSDAGTNRSRVRCPSARLVPGALPCGCSGARRPQVDPGCVPDHLQLRRRPAPCRLRLAHGNVALQLLLQHHHCAPLHGPPYLRFVAATVEGYAEGATTLVTKDGRKLLVDEPVKLGGKGIGANPLSFFLSGLLGCTQYTATFIAKASTLNRGKGGVFVLWFTADAVRMQYGCSFSLIGCPAWSLRSPPNPAAPVHRTSLAQELKLPDLGRCRWEASADFDMRGLRRVSPDYDARFQKLVVKGTFDTEASQQDLDAIAQQVEARCIVAATLRASGE